MDPMEAVKQTYFQECEELLPAMEEGLLAMESGEADGETVHAVFRAVHSIKGGGGAFGFDELVAFAHVFETVLDLLRSDELEPTPDVVATLLRAGDALADHVAAVQSGTARDPELDAPLLTELCALSGEEEGAAPGGDLLGDDEDFGFFSAPIQIDGDEDESAEGDDAFGAPFGDDSEASAGEDAFAGADAAEEAPEAVPETIGWRVRFRPYASFYSTANEPQFILRELARLGEAEIRADLSGMPALEDMDIAGSHLAWEIRLPADVTEEAINEIFDWVSEDCELVIEPLTAGADSGEAETADAEAPEAEAPAVGEGSDIKALEAALANAWNDIIDEEGGVDLEPAAEVEPETAAPEPAAAPKAIDTEASPARVGKPDAPAQGAEARGGDAAEKSVRPTIRVDPEKVDSVINLVGELVITQAMITQRLEECDLPKGSPASQGLDELEHLLRELQESVMAIRTQPVKSVFQRMHRLVREVAGQTGKQVRLVIDGESTEVDKTVIERLADPLTHMIRNAIDHGLETAEERVAAGKPAEGLVRLSAEHRGGRIAIDISDDGRGINRERVRQKAVQKGLIAENAVMSDEEIDNLIFHPGFSTAEAVSNLSGRGVGMDVVRRNITEIGGRITISSTPGKGSKFSLTLPLTLAVLDGMIISVGDQTYVLPISHVLESLQPEAADIRAFGRSQTLLNVRDTHVPLVRLGKLLDAPSAEDDPTKAVVILVESEGVGKLALVADSILGQRQVVIKSFETNYGRVEGIAAATILGDGRVALILDIDGLVERYRARPESAPAPAHQSLRMAS